MNKGTGSGFVPGDLVRVERSGTPAWPFKSYAYAVVVDAAGVDPARVRNRVAKFQQANHIHHVPVHPVEDPVSVAWVPSVLLELVQRGKQ